ncbi:MAG: hypothetical protein ACI8W3_002626 [Myxococcota bacterium]
MQLTFDFDSASRSPLTCPIVVFVRSILLTKPAPQNPRELSR